VLRATGSWPVAAEGTFELLQVDYGLCKNAKKEALICLAVQSIAPDDGAGKESPSPEEEHLKLQSESGLPPDHAAFQKWRLVKDIGHGAFSKVWLDNPVTNIQIVINHIIDCLPTLQ
jgi:hypothetical protein